MKIYGDSRSGNCLKVRWTAQLLGLPFDWEEVDILSGGSRTPAFLALNPAGQVPVVVLADGRTLAQSNAVMLYLAEGTALVPQDRYQRAKLMEWLFWEQYSHEPYVAVARFQIAYLHKRAEELEPRLLERARGALAHLESALGEDGFLLPGGFSLADIALVAYSRVAHEGSLNLAPYRRLTAWIARVEARLGLPPAR